VHRRWPWNLGGRVQLAKRTDPTLGSSGPGLSGGRGGIRGRGGFRGGLNTGALMGAGSSGGSASALMGIGRGGGSASGLMCAGSGDAGGGSPGSQPNPELIIININLIYYYNYYIFIN